jgi:hypothetical protein
MARRNRYTPSNSHKLTELIRKDQHFCPTSARQIREHLEKNRAAVADLAGVYGADWAIEQLATAPHVAKG